MKDIAYYKRIVDNRYKEYRKSGILKDNAMTRKLLRDLPYAYRELDEQGLLNKYLDGDLLVEENGIIV